jgi:hypothetical protein
LDLPSINPKNPCNTQNVTVIHTIQTKKFLGSFIEPFNSYRALKMAQKTQKSCVFWPKAKERSTFRPTCMTYSESKFSNQQF